MFYVKLNNLIRRMSLRTRLTLLFVTLFGISLIVSSAVTYRIFSKNVRGEFDTDLFNHAVDIAQGIEVDIYGDLVLNSAHLNSGIKVLPFKIGNSLVQISTLGGEVLARSSNLGGAELPHRPSEFLGLQEGKRVIWRNLSRSELPGLPAGAHSAKRYRFLSYWVSHGQDLSFVVQLAAPLTWVEQQTKGLLLFFWILTPAVLLLSALAGWVLSKKAFDPVFDMVEKARSISVLNLNERIPVPPVHDEIRKLALTFNGLLDRVQSGFQGQERFVSDASHQLRTPLAILRGEIDLLRRKPPSADQLQEFLESATQELEHLSRMVEDLLLLARVDAGASALSVQPVRMDEVAMDAVSRLKKFAQSCGTGVKFDLDFEHGEPEFEVLGDPDLLQSLLQTLIENAIKHAPQVEVTVSSEADWVWARVRDNGPGIPHEHHLKLFERFYRVNPGEEGPDPQHKGTGLGLAIAKRIAEVHHGLLMVESEPGEGSLFSFGVKRQGLAPSGIKNF